MIDAQSQIPDYDDDSEINEWQPLDDEGNVRAVSDYLAEMIAQLEDIAKRSRLDLLVYLLAMAKAEAQANAKSPAPPPGA